MLLKEEMRRVLAYHRWHAIWWDKKAAVSIDEGIKAYAFRQADVRKTLIAAFTDTWSDLGSYLSMGAGATEDGKFKHVEFGD